VIDLIEDPQLPFFVQWLCERSQHPSHGASGQVRIERMEICGDPDRVSEWLGEPSSHPLDDIEVDWVDGDEPGLVAVHLATAYGVVRID
jgi:hypothetical protein